MSPARRFRWLACSLLLCGTYAAAKPLPLDINQIGFAQAQVFDEGAGLTDLSTMAVSAAPDGYVWVGTMRGLSRFNGHRMVPVPGPGGALAHPIRDVLALPDGSVWVASAGGGLWRWREGEWQQLDLNAGLPTRSVVRLRSFPGAQGPRLFATGRNLLAEWDGERWHPRSLPAELAALEIRDVLPAAGPGGERLWLATFGLGLYRCDGAAACVAVPVPGPGERFFQISALAQAIQADGSATLWVGADGGGLARLHRGQWHRLTPRNSALPGDSVLAIEAINTPGREPRVWVGLRAGLVRLRNGNWENLDNTGMWASGRINALSAARDARGRAQMWVGSDEGAVRLRLQDDWRIVSRAGKGKAGVWALRFEHDRDGERLWLGSDGEGLARFQDQAWTRFDGAQGLPDDTVRSLARMPLRGGGDELWVGTWRGHLARFDGKRFHELATPWAKNEDEALAYILPIAPGEAWIGLRARGVAHLRDGRWTWHDGAVAGNPARVIGLFRTGEGATETIWAATFGQGLAAWRHGRWVYYGTKQGFPDDNVAGISLIDGPDGQPQLWVGSLSSGVIRLDIANPDKPRLVTVPALPVPPDDFIYQVLPDATGDLLVCTNYGVARWRPQRRRGFSPDALAVTSYTAFDYHRNDGLPHDECNAGAMQRDHYGRIWIGTIGGAAVYEPRATPAHHAPTPLRLESATVDGLDHSRQFLAGTIELDPAVQTVDLQFALLTGERESLNAYRSQLLPLESSPGKWSADNKRSFTGLPAGRYRLQVEGRDYAGVVSPPLTFSFTIPPPWWDTWPAWVAAAVLLIGANFLWGRWRLRRARLREQRLVTLVRERTSELEKRSEEMGRLNEELTRLSYRDTLTGLPNRRLLIKHLQDEWLLARARQTELAFLLFDIDHFKAYNDAYGHLAGDDCLREIGHLIQAELRKSDDSAGRYGGEEFGVVLPGLSLEKAHKVGLRILRALEHSALPHRASPDGFLSVSIGVASMIPDEHGSSEQLIAMADAALYRAKQGGRNRIEA